MEKLNQIYNYILNYIKMACDYLYPYAMELYNYLHNIILANKSLAIILGLLILYLYIKSRKPKRLRKKKFKKAKFAKKKRFYNTGIKCEFCFYDIIKFKLRLADYCDKKGVRYCYLFNIKLLFIEFLRMKYIDQKGQVYKRKITFRS